MSAATCTPDAAALLLPPSCPLLSPSRPLLPRREAASVVAKLHEQLDHALAKVGCYNLLQGQGRGRWAWAGTQL